MTQNESENAIEVAPEAATDVGVTSRSLRAKVSRLSANVGSIAGKAAALVGDLNGDGKVDGGDAKIVRDNVAEALSVATDEVGKLAKSVARAPLTKDVATYAAVGAAIALPLPVVGSAIGAAVGAGLGLWRNMTRHETLLPDTFDPIAELERLHGLKERGIITDDEFVTQKRKLLKSKNA